MPELAGRQAAEQREMLERGQLDLGRSLAAGPCGALVRTGELDALKRVAEPLARLSYYTELELLA